eukprot:scaffold21368_cov73-Isochrysis_galbana.AAC.2
MAFTCLPVPTSKTRSAALFASAIAATTNSPSGEKATAVTPIVPPGRACSTVFGTRHGASPRPGLRAVPSPVYPPSAWPWAPELSRAENRSSGVRGGRWAGSRGTRWRSTARGWTRRTEARHRLARGRRGGAPAASGRAGRVTASGGARAALAPGRRYRWGGRQQGLRLRQWGWMPPWYWGWMPPRYWERWRPLRRQCRGGGGSPKPAAATRPPKSRGVPRAASPRKGTERADGE